MPWAASSRSSIEFLVNRSIISEFEGKKVVVYDMGESAEIGEIIPAQIFSKGKILTAKRI